LIAIGVHDCQTGAAIAQEQVQAGAKEDVLRAVGDVVNTLRAQLGESLASLEKYDAPAEATTGSLDALRAYGLAVRTRVTRGDEESIPFFKQAIEIDPDFALAHAKLGVVYSNLGRHEDAKAATERAFALRDRVSEYERLYISCYARDGVDDDRELEMLQLLTTAYPRDFAARNNLGTYYMGRAQFDKALEQFEIAIEIAPNEPLPISNAAQSLFLLGRYEEALPLAERTLAVRPSGIAVTRMMHAHVREDPREAEFRETVLKVVPPDALAQMDQGLAVWDGSMARYEAATTRLIESLRASKRADDVAAQELNAAIGRALLQGGDRVEALRRAQATVAAPAAMKARAAAVLALLGDPAPARRGLAQWEQRDDVPDEVIAVVRAFVHEASGDVDRAIQDLRASIPADPRQAGRYLDLAAIQERAGRVDDAIASYRKVLEAAPAMGLNLGLHIWTALASVQQGRPVEDDGDRRRGACRLRGIRRRDDQALAVRRHVPALGSGGLPYARGGSDRERWFGSDRDPHDPAGAVDVVELLAVAGPARAHTAVRRHLPLPAGRVGKRLDHHLILAGLVRLVSHPPAVGREDRRPPVEAVVHVRDRPAIAG
jgi:tetratricopeptide (TPR) repeat protein